MLPYILFGGAALVLCGVAALVALVALARLLAPKPKAPAPATPAAAPPIRAYAEPAVDRPAPVTLDKARQAIQLLRDVEEEETARRYRHGAGRRGMADLSYTVQLAGEDAPPEPPRIVTPPHPPSE